MLVIQNVRLLTHVLLLSNSAIICQRCPICRLRFKTNHLYLHTYENAIIFQNSEMHLFSGQLNDTANSVKIVLIWPEKVKFHLHCFNFLVWSQYYCYSSTQLWRLTWKGIQFRVRMSLLYQGGRNQVQEWHYAFAPSPPLLSALFF